MRLLSVFSLFFATLTLGTSTVMALALPYSEVCIGPRCTICIEHDCWTEPSDPETELEPIEIVVFAR